MKLKLYFLTLLSGLLLQNATKAQTVSCNADFTFTISGLTVAFTPAMVGDSLYTYHHWNFGDGSSSTIPQPVHNYNIGGAYLIKHIITKKNPNGVILCSDTTLKTISLLNTTPCNLQANFTYAKDSLDWKKYYFTNTSLNIAPGDSIQWAFNDGSAPDYTLNPTHSFPTAGTYNVCLRVKRNVPAGTPPCISEICKLVVVTQPVVCNLQANFSYQQTPTNPNVVNFVNQTVNFLPTDSIKWSFGDGSPFNYTPNPVHTYSQPGTYTVCLRVKRTTNASTPPCISEICKVVVVPPTTAVCNIQAYFSYTYDSINRNKVYFTNQTVNFLPTDSIRWSFGDGSPYNYSVNPTHTYAQPGTYNVCIRVKRMMPSGVTPCISEFCKVVVIQPTCNIQAYFTYSYDSLNHNKVHFTNQTANFLPTDSIRWSFGDGSPFNYSVNPIHTYTQPGTYNVCIRVKRMLTATATPCISEYCKLVVIQPNVAVCNIQANFTSTSTTSNPLKVQFTNQTVNFLPTDSIRWNFGDGSPFSYAVNPDHTYTQSGLYTVCIRVKRTLPGSNIPCISEYCKQIYVGPTISNCNYVVDFSSRLDSINNRKVYFTNLSPVIPGATAYWNFGDGTTGTGWNTSHVYANGGSYNACLKVVYSYNCIKTKCKVIQLPGTNALCILQPYPNPASFNVNATVHLTQPAIIYTRIYNSQNIIVRQKQQPGFIGFNTVTVNVATLPMGIYRMVINYGNKECRGTFMKN